MVSKTILSRLQWLVWVAIYGGLLTISVASFLEQDESTTATAMYVVGGVLVAAGILMIYIRSRLRESP
jgi:threonine/homoserine/homoserine lactone efflux protein